MFSCRFLSFIVRQLKKIVHRRPGSCSIEKLPGSSHVKRPDTMSIRTVLQSWKVGCTAIKGERSSAYCVISEVKGDCSTDAVKGDSRADAS